MLISVEMMRLMAIVWTEKCFHKLHVLFVEKPRQEFVLQEKARCFYQWKWCDWWQLYATPVWTEKCFDRLLVYVDSREKVESSYPQEKARWFYQWKWCDWWKLYATRVSTEKCSHKLHAFIEKRPCQEFVLQEKAWSLYQRKWCDWCYSCMNGEAFWCDIKLLATGKASPWVRSVREGKNSFSMEMCVRLTER